jgi:heme oxygenase
MATSIMLVERLQTATLEGQLRMGQLPFFKDLAGGLLPLDSYLGLLKAMLVVHGALDQALAPHTHPALTAVWGPEMSKLDALQRDIAALGGRSEDIPDAVLRAYILAEQIKLRATRDPASLVGYVYVVAVWNLGGAALCESVGHMFELAGDDGRAYFASYDRWGAAHWLDFTARINGLPLDEPTKERVVAAAQEALDGIDGIVGVLQPIRIRQLQQLVTTLNPVAGHHPIPDDMREIWAALRAGERSWLQLPYYDMRYGMRGRRWTWSDSAWLVTLTRLAPERVIQQVHWLARYLSTRGMPQWTMELHLLLLYEELVKALPEQSVLYEKLLIAANTLAVTRRMHLDDDSFAALIGAFDAEVGSEWSARLPGSGGIVVSAVIDDAAGIVKALDSVASWMCDPTRFPSHWVAAVRRTIADAQARLIVE